MDVLLIGTLISNACVEKFLEKGISPQPADIAQRYILSGLQQNKRVGKIYAICSPRISDYKESGIEYVEEEIFDCNGVPVHTVGYNNKYGFGYINREKNLLRTCREFKNDSNSLLIIVYSLNTAFLKAALEVKKRKPNSIICVVVADLPIYMSTYRGVKRIAKAINVVSINRLKKYIDRYVLYSKHMVEPLKLEENTWIVIEGFADEKKININKTREKNKGKKICIYAGNLSPQYGIGDLIDAFRNISQNAELHIYGDSKEMHIENDDKIKYMGMLTPSEMFEIMKKADLLINPRPSSIPQSKYACPSKTFEYMSSGTAVIMCKLPGIPEEYFQYVYTFEDETQNGITKKLDETLAKTQKELDKKGNAAALFLLNNKTASRQIEKMLEFCKYEKQGKK